jgi:hypothetical protein
MTPTTTSIAATERLAALISAKRQVLEIVVRLARQQLEFIAGGDMTQLMKLLAGKQTVLAQLQTLQRQLATFQGDDPETRHWATPAARAACQAEADQANALLAEAMRLEHEADAAMRQRRDAAAAALAAAASASDARSAYGALPAAADSGLSFEG